jgi:hypothetical protein
VDGACMYVLLVVDAYMERKEGCIDQQKLAIGYR